MALFCKFKIPEPLGFIDVDAEEKTVRSYISRIISELRSGDATLVSASEFSDELWHTHNDSHPAPQPVTFVRVMLNHKPDEPRDDAFLTARAIKVLEGENLQITHTTQRGAETHIGFTQM